MKTELRCPTHSRQRERANHRVRRVGEGQASLSPLPSSNRTGGFPASGFPSSSSRWRDVFFAFRYRVICSCRTLSGAVSPRGPSPRPSPRFSPAEQVASLRSSVDSPNQRSGADSSLLRTPPTPAMARTASPFFGVVPPVEFCLLSMTGLPVYPCVTSRHVVHADPAGPLLKPATVSLGSNSAAFALT